jgi:hypothetical protein
MKVQADEERMKLQSEDDARMHGSFAQSQTQSPTPSPYQRQQWASAASPMDGQDVQIARASDNVPTPRAVASSEITLAAVAPNVDV